MVVKFYHGCIQVTQKSENKAFFYSSALKIVEKAFIKSSKEIFVESLSLNSFFLIFPPKKTFLFGLGVGLGFGFFGFLGFGCWVG